MPHRNRPLAHLAVLTALAVALVLTGCGRKGALDPPPLAAGPNGSPVPGATPQQAGEVTYGPDGQPIAPRGPQKRIFLDWLLD